MAWAGITYDRQYCDYTTKNTAEFYKCLDRFKIEKKGDFCIYQDPYSALRYFGGSGEFQQCLLAVDENVVDASDCNQKLEWAQRALYFNNTDFSIETHLKCFEKYGIPTEMLRC